jgi:PAS domain S-box-containing protein
MVAETQVRAASLEAGALDLIKRQHLELFLAWREALRMCWGEAAGSKLELLDRYREEGTDLVSLTLNLLAGSDADFLRSVDVLTTKVQHREYSIADLYAEVDCLEEVLASALGRSGAEEPTCIDAAVRWTRREIRRLFKAVLGETALIHETVIKGGRRGYCRLDETGRISLANAEVAELLGVEVAEGVNILDHISADAEQQYVLATVRGDYGSQPRVRRLRLTKRGGARITVNAEVGPLFIDGKDRGGYVVLTDVSAILKSEERIFDEAPLGIVRLDDKRSLIYANRTAREILGIGEAAIEGLTIWEFVSSEDARSILKEQAKLRDQGLSNEYPLEIRRLNDRESVPITVASMPEVDSSGHTVGTLSIIRSRAAEEIDKCIGRYRSDKDILEGVAKIVRKLIPCRSFVVSIFSYDDISGLVHTSPIFIHADEVSQLGMRWFPVSRTFVDWLGRLDPLGRPVPLLIPDWPAFLQKPEAEGLSDIPDVQRGLEEGQVKSFVVFVPFLLEDGSAPPPLPKSTGSAWRPCRWIGPSRWPSITEIKRSRNFGIVFRGR